MDHHQQLKMVQQLRENVVGTGSALQPSSSFSVGTEEVIITAEKDSLAAEGRSYAERLKQAGVKVFHKEYEGAPHGFTHFGDLAVAEEAWHLMSDKLKKAFSTAKKD
ncbi:alpha/beta hydrolase fold [Paenibacillus sp. RU5A]|nr:alpha/beta hydrolase fold [Paenibacillus sp. RU5A]SOC72004.1 alpha/beta hydrolase fold [Paenibacillus sp. RU26A]SOC74359.1 alpha/beta hydrolase fold [Paenibacillus sp. RU5M]